MSPTCLTAETKAVIFLMSSSAHWSKSRNRELNSSSLFLSKLWKAITQRRIDRLTWYFVWYHIMTMSITLYSFRRFWEVKPPQPVYLHKNFKLAKLKRYSMNFSEILHEWPSNPLTNLEYDVGQSRNYFDHNLIEHFSQSAKSINFFYYDRGWCVSATR